MGIQEVGMRAGKEKEVNFNEERSRVGSKISQVAERRSMGGKSRSMVGLEKEKSKSSAKEEEEEGGFEKGNNMEGGFGERESLLLGDVIRKLVM